MSQYSEATTRVFERALQLLEGALEPERLEAVRALVASGSLDDLKQLDEILGPLGVTSAD